MKICAVMPAYDEAEGIGGLLLEIKKSLHSVCVPRFVVINDSSLDETSEVVRRLGETGFPVTCIVNEINSGHGVSTRKSLDAGLESGSELVISVDGDRQFNGAVIARLVDAMKNNVSLDVVEGSRVASNDPPTAN